MNLSVCHPISNAISPNQLIFEKWFISTFDPGVNDYKVEALSYSTVMIDGKIVCTALCM